MDSKTKICSGCKIEKLKTEFYKHKLSKGGLNYYCKACCSGFATSEKGLKSRRAYEMREATKKIRRDHYHTGGGKEYQKAWNSSDKGKLSLKKSQIKHAEENPIKRDAKNKVNNAIKSGKLIKESCEVCSDAKVEGHHDDYSKPLGVRWLCKKHHIAWHKENGKGVNG